MPILKQLVSSSSQSKRRSRSDLTVEMISAPLGDFRHTMHVGRGGDAFGDTSFLSSRSGEPPRESNKKQNALGPKPSLLSRTFRSSMRSQSANRGDKQENAPLPSAGSSQFVKTAISLPYLNADSSERERQLPKSTSSSPMKSPVEAQTKPANDSATLASLDAEFEEYKFGDLTDLPPSLPKGGAMRHAESVMSFQIDLGPSMLGDILSVMEKKSWEDDDLGYGSPAHIPLIDDDVAEERTSESARRTHHSAAATVEPYTPELRNGNHGDNADSCSVSSSESEKPHLSQQDGDTDSAKYSSPRGEEDFTFMDEDEDEIRV